MSPERGGKMMRALQKEMAFREDYASKVHLSVDEVKVLHAIVCFHGSTSMSTIAKFLGNKHEPESWYKQEVDRHVSNLRKEGLVNRGLTYDARRIKALADYNQDNQRTGALWVEINNVLKKDSEDDIFSMVMELLFGK